MENKKLTLTIGIITFIMCFAFVTIIVVMLDSQQHTIANQTQKIDESQKIIDEQTTNLNEFQSGEKFARLSQELSTLQLQLNENNEKMLENQEKIEQKNAELTQLNEKLTLAQTKLEEQEQKLAEQIALINDQKAKLDILSENLDFNEQLLLIQDQKLQIEALKTEINETKNSLSEREALISSLNTQITKLNATITEQKAKIDEQALAIETGSVNLDTDVMKLLQEKQSLISEQQKIIEEQAATLTTQEALTEELEQRLDENTALMTEKDNQILSLYTEIKSLKDEIDKLNKTVEDQKALFDANTTHYVVTFVADGVVIENLVVEKGKNIASLPAIPSKTGYTARWSENGEKIDKNKFIYAIYTPIDYKISYDLSLNEKTDFRFATFNLADTQLTLDFLKKVVSFPAECEIVEGKFTLNNVVYTLDSENSCIRAGKRSYLIDNNTFIIDRIYKIANDKVTWENSVTLKNNTFTIDNKVYQLVEDKIESDDISTYVISFSQPSLNFTFNTQNKTVIYTQGSKQHTIKVSQNRFVIGNQTYEIDLINHSFNLILGNSTFKSNNQLPATFNIEDKFFKLPKALDNYVNLINVDGKTFKPSGWKINGINYLISEDDDYIYVFPLNQANVVVSINWE